MITKKDIIKQILKRLNAKLDPNEFISVWGKPNNWTIDFGDSDTLQYDNEEEVISALQGVEQGMGLCATR